ncbi:hypothetical protein CAPTEDRAFT_86930, partial [Capitella teleta]
FYIIDLGDAVAKYNLWKKLFPEAIPHYAVKCNDDPGLLATFASLGIGFDCASKGEIAMVKDLGVASDRIIYANPCKQKSHIKYAKDQGVMLMT